MGAVRDEGAERVHDVAVVGFGPSGAIAAGLLGQAGLDTWVSDRARDVHDIPRAIAMDHEILRVIQQLGLEADIAPHVEPFTPSEYFGVDGQLIRRMTMLEQPWPLAHVPSNVFTQPPFERALRAHVASLPTVDVELGVEVVALAQDAQAVTLHVRDGAGRERTVRARHVIGCDGASSTVRALAGIELDDLGFDEPWLVVDVRVNERGLAKLPATSVQWCEPSRPCTYVIGPGDHRRWEISLVPGEDPAQVATPEGTWKLLSRWIGPDDATLWRQASYRFHALVARDWRRGRVFLAGDAAHQQPPFLGQGMCQGVRDVANLAWKLVAVHRGGIGGGGIRGGGTGGDAGGTAAEALLDSYGTERGAHVRELITRIKGIGAVICERDPERARARDERLLAECGGVVRDTPRQDLMPRIGAGWLSVTDHPAQGTPFPQPWIVREGDRVRLDELTGCGWRLVVAAGATDLDDTLPRGGDLRVVRIGDVPGAFAEADGVVAGWFRRHGCRAALVRPDHQVWGVADDARALAALLDELLDDRRQDA